MWLDALLAILHHICVFGLFVILAAEMVLIRPGVTAETITRVVRIDLMYGILAALALIAGGLRVMYGAKGAAFYTQNPIFWSKLGLFVVVGLLSVRPTLQFMRWQKALHLSAAMLPGASEIHSARRFIHIEIALLFLLPVLAALMARGIGHMS